MIAVTVSHYVGKESEKKLTVGPIQSIAVLPLANLSSDPAQEYFTDGLTDELITELARIGTLRVISHTSVAVHTSECLRSAANFTWMPLSKVRSNGLATG